MKDEAKVAVVVIAFRDRGNIGDAIESALGQGPAVAEVVVVDDASGDGTAEAAEAYAAGDPRVRVVRRTENSGGCGTPRNDGLAVVTAPWVMFLDSDDVLPHGAATRMLSAATEANADAAVGLCVRRELPSGREVPWQPELFDVPRVLTGLSGEPRFLRDTLCVNKLYRRDFLDTHKVRFPEGAAHYEDFVFTARFYAAEPVLAVTPEPVYIWHVRRAAAGLSISLRRHRIANWTDRLDAHRQVTRILRAAGRDDLATAAQAKFVDHDLPLYLRDLPGRDAEYRAQWWAATRAYLAEFDPEALASAEAARRWAAAAVLASPVPEGLPRLAELAAAPARLVPPYAAAADGGWRWPYGGGHIDLDGLDALPPGELPLCVDGRVEVGVRRIDVSLTVHDIGGRLAAAGPQTVRLEFRHRLGARTAVEEPVPLHLSAAEAWHAHVSVRGIPRAESAVENTWDVWAVVSGPDGDVAAVKVRAGSGLGRRITGAGGFRLIQPYAAGGRALALRVADGWRGMASVAGRKMGTG
ncbi:glycosyltransferase family 2 protein [Uniformispora flossi]|uniref:glycosyltransferase family 2 protein n=1 Tax=Uniformispora flossi TaxID=3390723 RepID=UPI003C2D49BB